MHHLAQLCTNNAKYIYVLKVNNIYAASISKKRLSDDYETS